jgi:hypothetical protein
MFDPLRIDAWIIEWVFEPIAWTIQSFRDWLNNFVLARIMLILWPLPYFGIATAQQDVVYYLASGWVVFLSMVSYVLSEQAEDNVRKGGANVFRVFRLVAAARLLLVLLLPWVAISAFLADACATAFYIAFLYLCACDSMPPNYRREIPLPTPA